MPASYGSRPWSLNPFYWIEWVIAGGVAFVSRELQYLWHRTNAASGSEKAAWIWRCLVSCALVAGEWVLLERTSLRRNVPVAFIVVWVTLLLLPNPTPRIPLLIARLLAVVATIAGIGAFDTWAKSRFRTALAGWSAILELCYAALWLGLGIWAVLALRPHRGRSTKSASAEAQAARNERWSNVPKTTFADFGGSARVKEEVQLIAENRFSKRSAPIVRNGILLYGPQGTGKNLLAEATAGECRVNFYHVRCPELMRRYIGESSEEIRRVFEWAAVNRPIVLFLDEIDSIGSRKQVQGSGTDSGGGGREFNLVATQLMQSIDQYRQMDGLLIMAATNYLDGLEPTLVRDGRFDAKLRLDLPMTKTGKRFSRRNS